LEQSALYLNGSKVIFLLSIRDMWA